MIGKVGGSRPPSFQLFDTRKYFAELRQHRVKVGEHPPRIHFFGRIPGGDPGTLPWPIPLPRPDGLVGAARLSRRLQVLKLALDDLPRQARRLARWRVRRETMPSPKFKSPLRPGPPPGHRRKPSSPQSMRCSSTVMGSPGMQ